MMKKRDILVVQTGNTNKGISPSTKDTKKASFTKFFESEGECAIF